MKLRTQPMTPERIQRTIDFILKSQADSMIRMDRLESNIGRLEVNVGRLEGNIGQLESNIGRLEVNVGRLEGNVGRLEKNTDRLAKNIDRLVKNQNRLVENQERQQEQIDGLRSAAADLLKVGRQLVKTTSGHSVRIERLESGHR